MKIAAKLGYFFCFSNLFATPTSVTDDGQYPQFCQRAADSSVLFSEFKRIPTYAGVVETVSYEQGKEYLEAIKRQSPELLDYIETFKSSDSVGCPQKFYYSNIGEISPTTLRYIKIASDLKMHFGSLDECTIVEIGAGYGGQCKILADIFNFKKYVIIDLPGPLALAKRFLNELNIQNVHFFSFDSEIPDEQFDLAISNYAFSECTEKMQQRYIEDIFKKSDKGYLICNNFPEDDRLSHLFSNKQKSLNELRMQNIPWIELEEYPRTSANNYLIIWNRHLEMD